MTEPTGQRKYSRDDLDELKTFDRQQIIRALSSFDDEGLDEGDFIRQMSTLLLSGSPDRVFALASAADGSFFAEYFSESPLTVSPQAATRAVDTEYLVKSANDILEHRFTFYAETHQLPDDIDWDFNPGTAHWSHDLNRFSFLGTLTRAFEVTKDSRYSRKAIDLMLDWIAKSDIGKAFIGTPYAFGSYLNQAIHCEAWATCLLRLVPESQISPIEVLRIAKSLHEQMAYLSIVTNGHGGNWPTIGCRGILAVAASLPFLTSASTIAVYAIQCLGRQVADQVLPDGVQDELTPHYHWTVVDRLIGSVRYARAMGLDLEPETLETLRKMIRYTRQTIVPDGSAQVAFNDSDPAAVPAARELLYNAGLGDMWGEDEAFESELFPYAGVSILRSRSAEDDLYMAFDGGPFGRGHQHEDKLGFWLYAYGRNLLVDPGRHLYDWSDVSYYDYLKTTHAHSTITVDGAGQNSRGRPDTWIPEKPVPVEWDTTETGVRVAAEYSLGYGPENAIGVTHRRTVCFVGDRFWVILDRVTGSDSHVLDLRWQFAPGEVFLEGSKAVTGNGDANLVLWSIPSSPFTDNRVETGEENPRRGWYSKSYGHIEPAPAVSLSVLDDLPFSAATLLYPFKGTKTPELVFTWDGETVVVSGEETGERLLPFPSR